MGLPLRQREERCRQRAQVHALLLRRSQRGLVYLQD